MNWIPFDIWLDYGANERCDHNRMVLFSYENGAMGLTHARMLNAERGTAARMLDVAFVLEIPDLPA